MRSGRSRASTNGMPPRRLDRAALSAFLRPRFFVFFSAAQKARNSKSHMGNHEMAPPDKDIILDLGDVLHRVPSDYLKPGPHDPKQQVRFKFSEISGELASGKTTMPLARLAKVCPEVFKSEVNGRRDIDVTFPYQKVMAQIPGTTRTESRGRVESRIAPMAAELFPPRRSRMNSMTPF